MKIRFTQAPKGRDHKVGDIVEFAGPIPEGYARKYINRGWAVEIDEAAERRQATEDRAKAEAERKQKLAAERATVVIPEKFADLPWADLQALAVKLSDGPIKGKQDAVAAIDAEIKRRSGI